MLTTLWLAVGLVLLTVGGDVLVRGATTVARLMKVSPLLVGLTLVGFGTSTPELVTSLTAALAGSPGIAIGNVVGSNTANILLILGLTAAIMPIAVQSQAFRRDGLALAVATLLALGAVLLGLVDRWMGAVFVTVLIGYIVWAYLDERSHPDAEAELHVAQAAQAPGAGGNLWFALGLAVGGIALTIAGARLLVDSAIVLARDWGVSDTVIGLTVVAVGTSLPEMVTSLMAALRRQADVALGNIVGSNIYNVLGILGITALVHPIQVPAQIMTLDIWVMLAATAGLLLFARSGHRLSRLEGAALLLAYVAYVGWMVVL